MQHSHTSSPSVLNDIHIDFMDVYYELHQRELECKKKTKAKRRFEARRGIEEHMEQKRLRAVLSDWWEEK